MTPRTRLLLIAAAVLLVLAFGQYAMNRWTCWTPETKASVWVAFGTILLAVATFWSVWETRLVIRGEDRRHQQSLAPSIRVQGTGNEGRGVFAVVNRGMGLATRVRVRTNATITSTWARDGSPSSEDAPGDKTFSQVAPSDSLLWNVLPPDILKRADGVVTVKGVRIEYQDMFGNTYETVYPDWSADENDFEWHQPESLRTPKV